MTLRLTRCAGGGAGGDARARRIAIPSPAVAGGAPRPQGSEPQAAMTKVVRKRAGEGSRSPRGAHGCVAAAGAGAEPRKDSPAFFKTRTGLIIALAVMVAGCGLRALLGEERPDHLSGQR